MHQGEPAHPRDRHAEPAKGRVEPALFNAYHALELACKAAILPATGPKRAIHDPPHNLEIQREHY